MTGPLTTYIGGLGSIFQLVEDWASDTDNGEVGWSLLVDIDRCPDEALPWLAQLIGVKLTSGLTADDHRNQIISLANFRRGTPDAIASAPAPYLTGGKTVIIRERYNGTVNDAPYNMEVITYASETADPAIVEAAIRAQKPAGIILDYQCATGQDFQTLKDGYTTFQDVKNAYATFAGVKADTPGV